MELEKMKSAIHNNVVSGLKGATINQSFTLEQIEDDIILERLNIIKEYSVKNLIPVKDLVLSINCIQTDCEAIDRCNCCNGFDEEKLTHFELPQVLNDFGEEGIQYIGSTDRKIKFKVYTDHSFNYHKNKRRGAERPYVWVDTSPNENNMYDAFVFNAPLIKMLSVTAIFKDPRQLEQYECCNSAVYDNYSFVDKAIITRLTEQYIRYYRQMAMATTPNNQMIK